MPLVTISIPVYNAEKFIAYAIQSVINQTFQDWILIVLEDGSNDKTLEIAMSFNDKRIKVISDGQNKGLVYRLNQSIALTKTKYYARMDADDIMVAERIATQIKILENNPNIDVLGTNAYSIDENNKIIGLKNAVKNEIIKTTRVIHPSIMAKTAWLKKNKYDIKAIRCEDAELWIRTYNTCILMEYKMPLIYYREFMNMYYKKYFKSLKGLLYITKKLYKNNRIKESFSYFLFGVIKTIFVGFLYYIFNICSLEHLLLKKRTILVNYENIDKAQKELNKIIINN